MATSIRRERPEDRPAVAHVLNSAFRRSDGSEDEPPEVGLVAELRGDASWLSPLSLVAEIDGEVVAHAVCTRATVDDVAVLALGPIGVLPAMQRRGVGTALMNGMIVAAGIHGEAVICLLGDPEFYSRFGFVEASTVGIEPPDAQWGRHFQALVSSQSAAPAGRFRYADPFRNFE